MAKINNTANDTLLSGTSGADSIQNGGWDGSYNYGGTNVTIKAGAGNDYIINYGNSVTIDAGAGNDSIINYGSSVTIDAGAGNDSINNLGDSVTIDAGTGDDLISLRRDSKRNVIIYNAGDGSDTIVGLNADDTLSISGGSYSTQASGKDVIVTVGEDKITLQNVYVTDIHINDEMIEFERKVIKLSDGGDTIYATRNSISILGGAGDDFINNHGSNVSISAGAGKDTIHNYSANVSIDAGDGNDYIDSFGNSVTIDAGAGNDSISLGTSAENNVIVYNAGDGNDKVCGFNSDDTLKISGGSYSISKGKKNVIVTVDDGKITLVGAASLSAVNIDGEEANTWKLNGTTATYGSLVITGVISLDGIKLDGTTVTVSAASLGKKKVTVSDGYKLVLGSDVDKTSATKAWTLKNSTATYTQTTTAGYSLVDNEIIYSKAATENLITVSGVKSLDGLKVKGTTVTVTKSSLGTKDVTLSGDGYTLALGSTVPAPTTAKATYSDGVYKTAGVSKAGYSLDGNTIRYVAKDIKTIKFSGAADDATVKNFSLSGNVMTIGKAAMKTNGTAFKLLTDGYSLNLGKGITASATDDAWTLSGSTAKLKRTTTVGYSLDDNEIIYSKKSSKTLATVTGVTSLGGLSVSGKVITVSAASLGTEKISVSDGYTLALGSDVSSATTKKSWSLSGSTAKLKRTTTAGYFLDGNEIIYSKKSSKTLAKVKGVTSLGGLSVSGKVITVSAASLGTEKISVSEGYTLALGDDVSGSSTKKSWSLKDSTATYKQTTAAGYSLVDNEIIYSKKSSKTLAKVKGVNDKSGLKVSGKTIKLSGDALSKKVTVSGDYVFDFDSAYSNASITGSSSADTILARGKNIFVTGGDGSDVFALKSTGTIGDYDSEDKISLTGAADITTDGDEKIFEPEEDNSVQYNADGTAATLTMHYTDDDFDATKYAGALVTIDASAVLHPLNITGNKNANNIFGTNEDDFIDGGISGDKIFGGAGNDTLLGAAGNDLLSGDEDDDLLSGGAGKDTLRGGAGNDELWGGAGNDVLEGGDGSDVFIYSVGDGNDTISDYEQDVDIVKILSGVVKSPTTDTAGNVTFSMEGSGQLVFTGAANKIIEIFDGSGNLLKHYNPK